MKFALISLGCSKNLVDSENFIGILVNKRGFEVTSELGEADIIIVNTCGFIGDAKKESIETILEVSDLKINGNLKKNNSNWMPCTKIRRGNIKRTS